MGKAWLGLVAAAILLAACGKSSTRVEQPFVNVYGMLASLPAEANAMPLAIDYPGSSVALEPKTDQLIWHFTHQGIEYGRMIADIAKDGEQATNVTTHFEDVRDNPVVAKFDFLRKTARIAAEASLAAALSRHSVDQVAVRAQINQVYVDNPVAMQMKMMEGIAAQMDKMAPPDSSESDDPAIRRQAERMEQIHGCGSVNGVPNPC